ncbi:response regulator [Pseudoroseomonas globiformis]|uniref:Response regulator n=1 Tax=Teichococcus globiformis TaxID=2307229 RepID=A0ABV7G291_9PROT
MTTILVVDDEFLVSDLLASALEDQGYHVTQAHHGRKALAVLAREKPALIITDFMMPLMNGLELAQAVKEDTRWRHLPIILLSGAQGSIARGHPHLFADVFDKPFPIRALVARVRELAGPPAEEPAE